MEYSRSLVADTSKLVKKYPLHFMEPECSLPHLQQPATYPCPERSQYSPRPQPISWISSLILPSIYAWASKWSLSLQFPYQHPIRAACPAHLILLYHSNSIWLGSQSTKLLVMLSSPLPCYLVPLRPKYLPQHPQSTFLSQCDRLRLTPTPNDRLNYSSVYYILRIFGLHPWGTTSSTVSPAILSQVCKSCLRGVQRS